MEKNVGSVKESRVESGWRMVRAKSGAIDMRDEASLTTAAPTDHRL